MRDLPSTPAVDPAAAPPSTGASEALFARARAVTPGGVALYSRHPGRYQAFDADIRKEVHRTLVLRKPFATVNVEDDKLFGPA